jgi:hypothetical protein
LSKALPGGRAFLASAQKERWPESYSFVAAQDVLLVPIETDIVS